MSKLPVFIYVIGREQGPVKVGVSSMPEARMGTLQTGCPFRLSLLHVRQMRNRDHALEYERNFRADHAAYHLHGEWYRCDADFAIDGIECAVETEQTLRAHYGRPT